jgi:hypothetical protein
MPPIRQSLVKLSWNPRHKHEDSSAYLERLLVLLLVESFLKLPDVFVVNSKSLLRASLAN